MPGLFDFLDDIFLGRRKSRDRVREFFDENNPASQPRIGSLTQNLVTVQKRQASANNIGFATALQRTTGILPENLGRRTVETVALPSETYDSASILREAGAREGVNVAEVLRNLNNSGRTNNAQSLTEALAQMNAQGESATRFQARNAPRTRQSTRPRLQFSNPQFNTDETIRSTDRLLFSFADNSNISNPTEVLDELLRRYAFSGKPKSG